MGGFAFLPPLRRTLGSSRGHENKNQEKEKRVDGVALSCVFRAANHFAFHFTPIDIIVDALVHFAADYHIVAADEVQPMLDLRTRLWVVGGPDDAFDRVQEHQIRQLVGG